MKQKYSQDIGIVQKLQSDKKEALEDLETIYKEKEVFEMQKILLQDASEEARKNARDLLQNIATNALQYILGEYLSLEIILDEKGDAPVAEFVVKSKYPGYTVEADPAEEEGGGVADIVAFSNFIAMAQLTGSDNVAPFLLDEPSKYVSKAHSENVGKFFYEISGDTGRQVIMVTHDAKYLAKIGDVTYHFKINEGVTVATKL